MINLHGLLSLRGGNFRWADLVSGNLKEVGSTSSTTLDLRNSLVKHGHCRVAGQFEKHIPSTAKAAIDFVAVTARLKPCPSRANPT
jgi:hypothetical protein